MNQSFFSKNESGINGSHPPMLNVNKRLEAIAGGFNNVEGGMNYHNFGSSNEVMISEMLKNQRNYPFMQKEMMLQSNEILMPEMLMQQRNMPMNPNGARGFSSSNMLSNNCNVLLVENVPNEMANMGAVCNIFGTVGVVEDVKIVERRQLVALVQMQTPEMAQRALLREQDYKNISPLMNVNLCTDVESVISNSCIPGTLGRLGGLDRGYRRGPRRMEEDSCGETGKVLLINDMPTEMAQPKFVYNLFSLYGEITKVQIMEKQPTKGLVETTKPSEAEVCRRYLNGIEVCGSRLSVSISNKSSLGGHDNDPFYQEFHGRTRRSVEKNPYAPTPVLFITNIPCETEELRNYIVESGFTVRDIQRCGKAQESALVRLASVEEAILAVIQLQDTLQRPQSGERRLIKNGLNIMFSPRADIVSLCHTCNQAGHLKTECPTSHMKK